MVRTDEDMKEAQALQAAALELLSVNLSLLGYISDDCIVKDAVMSM